MLRVIALTVSLALGFLNAAYGAESDKTTLNTHVDGQADSHLFVPQGLGLNTSITNIVTTLEKAKATKALTSIEVNEYLRRLNEVKTPLESANASFRPLTFHDKQLLAKSLFELTDTINKKLIPAPPTLAMTEYDLQSEYNQVKDRIARNIRDGRMHSYEAQRFRTDAKRIYESALKSKQAEDLQIASRDLRKLEQKVQMQTASRVRSEVGNSFLIQPRVF